MLEQLKKRFMKPMELPKRGLVTYTWETSVVLIGARIICYKAKRSFL